MRAAALARGERLNKELHRSRMNAITRLPFILLLWLGLVPFAAAQAAPFRYDLLALVPDDFTVCVVLHDLRGHAARWEQSAWLKTFRQSVTGKSFLDSPEMRQLERWQGEMKKHLDLDGATLRDDILGDTLIFSYSPGPKNKPDDERGLFLLHVRKPDRLFRLIDNVNEAQTKSGDLKKLTELRYKGHIYHHRQQGGKSQYYFVKESLAAVTTKEEVLHAFLDRRSASTADTRWAKRFQRAGADSAFIILCVNPRMLDAEIVQHKKKDDPFPGYWRALEGIFVTVAIKDDVELRLSLQANTQKLPEWAKSAFTQTTAPSSLWQRFPEQSIVTLASKTDFSGAGDALKLLMPDKDRKKLITDWQGTLGAVLRLDPFKDILPNIGPDWGICVLPSKDAKQLPRALFALAVKPGSKDEPVDQTLLKAVELFAGIAVLDHNLKHPDSIIRMESVMQGKVKVRYLTNDQLFPPSFQPACALKDGFLLFATSPDAIASFRLHVKKADERKDTPLLRVSAPELARLLEHRREHILSSLAAQNMSPEKAKKNLEDVIGLLGLFEHATLNQHGDAGQASWSIHLTPSLKSK
jgi:hypothetical protein